MGSVRISYNGYTVNFIPSTEVESFIQSKLHYELKPVKIVDFVQNGVRVVVYQYYTLYQEVFVITNN